MGNITDFLKKYESEYTEFRQKLDHNWVVGKPADPAVLLGVSYYFRRERRVWKRIGMAQKDINDYVAQLRDLASELPMRPGCLSVNSILDFIEESFSEKENHECYAHLCCCSFCKDKVFKAAWFFLD